MATIKFNKTPQVKQLRTSDLKLTDTFRLVNGNTVYMFVQDIHHHRHMLELATGKLFPLSNSNVVLVDVLIEINQ